MMAKVLHVTNCNIRLSQEEVDQLSRVLVKIFGYQA
jgi:hypothetical protein